MSVNKVILVGSLGRDPEMKYMPNGDAICNFSIATSERFKKDGQPQERTEWHRCVVYRKLAEVCGQYLVKGSQVYVEGKIQSREWQDKEGAKRTTTEIIVNEMKMLGGKKQEKPAQAESPRAKAMQGIQDIDSDLPF